MAMVVKNNMGAVKTLNTLNKNSSALQKSLAKVSSGMKINSAQDDASGYAISEKMRVQIRSLDQANQNTQNASSLMKTAEGAVSSTVEILKSLKEKAINAATDTNTDSDRATIQKEINQFADQIDDNALTTFNGKYLVDGSKMQQGNATYTAMVNQNLSTETTSGTSLTDLANRNGEYLEIESTDTITASFVKNGKTYTTKFDVKDLQLKDIFENLNSLGNAEGIGDVFGAQQLSAGSSSSANPAYATAQKAVTDAQTNLDNATNALNDIIDTLLNTTIPNLSNIKNNSAFGETWVSGGNNTTYTQNFKNAATIVTNSLNDLKVDGTTAGSGTLNFAAITGSTYYNSYSDIEKNIIDSANNWSWNYSNQLANAVNAQTSAFSTAVSTYNNALTSLSTAQATLASTPQTIGGGGGTTGDMVAVSTDIGANAAGDMVKTADGTNGVIVTSAGEGILNQISGLTISVADSEGNVKKSANAALDAFSTSIYAVNKSSNNELTFQVGASANQSITVGLQDMRSEALGLKSSGGDVVSVATQDKANAAIAVFDNAIKKAIDQQTTIGAVEARLDYTSNNLTTSSENVQAAESTIRDADMAKEMTNYTKNNVLLQAAQSMLAQANQSSSQVLSLLQ